MDVGVKINQYVIVEHIGRGGMADVWSARDERLNRMVAIKTIAHGLSQEVDPVGLFKQEAQTIAKMEHPHILPIYDFGEYAGQLYIVMRFVAGGSLDEILGRGPLPMNEALRLGEAVANALDYAHSQQVIHLDLKPPNILMDSQYSPYLADFGLATKLDPGGKANNPGAGTLLYMAPEQLTAEMIDHRADIYSFTILLWHMLTGELPFQAETPLALRQLQYYEDLPDITEFLVDFPPGLNDILRQGTAVEPEERPPNLGMLIDMIRQVMAPTAALETSESIRTVREGRYEEALEYMDDEGEPLSIEDLERLEAADIYARARHAWAGGNGRFLLGVTHFMIMNGYYMKAREHDLELDDAGRQMILRGALEYDIDVEYWWNQLEAESQRWVCLHAIRSGNAPARVRALYRIETLPDSEPPQIPRLVAQALQIENNEEARLAALHVLSTRVKLMKPHETYDIDTQYRGRMLTTITRLGIQLSAPNEWTEVIYSPEIDLLIAETALDYSMPRVAEFAARVIGRIRSTAAVRYVVNQQKKGRGGAFRALALIRDETPNLPSVVNRQGRFYAWTTNTFRRMFNHPLQLVRRYVYALIGAWLAMGYHVYAVFRNQSIFAQQRWANAIAIGLIFAILTGGVALFSDAFSSRLRGFWHPWLRLLAGFVIGTFWGAFAWWSLPWFYLNVRPGMDIVLFGGSMMALGFTLRALFNLKSWIAIPLTALLIYIPIFITFNAGWMYEDIGPFSYGNGWLQFDEALLYYAYEYAEDGSAVIPAQLYNVAIPFVLLIALGGYLPLLLKESRNAIFGNPESRRQREHIKREEERKNAPPVTEVPDLDTLFFETGGNTDGQMNTRPLSELESQLAVTDGKPSKLDMKTVTDIDVDVDPYSTNRVAPPTEKSVRDDDIQEQTTAQINPQPDLNTIVDHELGQPQPMTEDEEATPDVEVTHQSGTPSMDSNFTNDPDLVPDTNTEAITINPDLRTSVDHELGKRSGDESASQETSGVKTGFTNEAKIVPDTKTAPLKIDPSLKQTSDDASAETDVDEDNKRTQISSSKDGQTNRVNIGTGIRVDAPNMETEFDVNKGIQDSDDDEEDDS